MMQCVDKWSQDRILVESESVSALNCIHITDYHDISGKELVYLSTDSV